MRLSVRTLIIGVVSVCGATLRSRRSWCSRAQLGVAVQYRRGERSGCSTPPRYRAQTIDFAAGATLPCAARIGAAGAFARARSYPGIGAGIVSSTGGSSTSAAVYTSTPGDHFGTGPHSRVKPYRG